MNKKRIKIILAPIGVLFGITLFITLCISLTKLLDIYNINILLPLKNYLPVQLLGVLLLLLWFPIFISSIYFLGQRGAVGQAESLRVNGIYKYIRNPMYSGISFTIIAIGLILDITGVLLAGIIWFILTFIQCKREEKELLEKFREKYSDYKNSTPMYIPDFIQMIYDIKRNRKDL